jgi:dipeptidyl aminopeptidase/acylaminoacyl peptidase
MTYPRSRRDGWRIRSVVVRSLAVGAFLVVPLQAAAQVNGAQAQARTWVDETIRKETFASPPQELLDAVLAPRHLNISLSNPSPDKRWFLNGIGDGPVKMDVFSKPFDELGGVFIDASANRARTLTIRNDVGLQIISAADGSKRAIQVPNGARVSGASWSPDGSAIAFLAHFPDATHIFVADPANGRSRQLTRTPLLATMVTSFQWVDDGSRIAAVLIPDNRPARPVKPAVPAGPQVKVAEEADKNLLRTYASLMSTPHDQALLKWHATGQLALIDVASRAVKKVGQPTLFRSIDPSPDGKYVRVTRMTEPFSYVVPVNNFSTVDEIWDENGAVLAEIEKNEMNLGVRRDNPPTAPGVGGGDNQNQQGKRELTWRKDGRGLTYLEQEPARNAGRDSAAAEEEEQEPGDRPRRKDRVMLWLPPFDSTSRQVVYESDNRMSNHRYSPDMRMLFVQERTGQNVHEFAVDLSNTATRHTLARYRTEDFYANPGSLVLTTGGFGGGGFGGGGGGGGGGGAAGATVQLSSDGQHVFYQGTQYDKNPQEVAPRSFIDKVAIRTGTKQRIYEGDNNGVSERVVAILDQDATSFVVSRETPTEVPQNFLRANGQLTQLTQNRDYTPDITSARREHFVVERPDGFKFRVNVTMPVNWREGERVPAMFWFYPREYQGQEEYDRGARTFNKNEFPNLGLRSMEFLTRLGYAVVEPDAPIIGEQGQMNNNYEHDLRNNLAAVIDELDRRALIDRQRIGLGGHSYGAFSTVNAMVHTPFFKAGIAGDGAYNRTLTPLGFQSERRTFWEARDVYVGMSPFMHANNLTGALLMYHGLHDQNVGTDPINSPRLFHALNGLGKTVSMYLYPYEDHGPATHETTLDLWARWSAWLDKYVKNPQSKDQPRITTTTDSAND